MDAGSCKLGYRNPQFHDITDLEGIKRAFYLDGVAFLAGCDEDRLVALGEGMGAIVKPRNEVAGARGVSNIRCAPGLVGKGYSSEGRIAPPDLFFHTDRSGWDDPPRILITTMKLQSETGGDGILVDGRLVVEAARARCPSLYQRLRSSKYSSFTADDGTFIPRPIYDDKKDVLRFRFDDGIQLSPSLLDDCDTLTKLMYENAFAITLRPGQGYIVDNTRFLHARTSFTGSRELLRVLAHPHPARNHKFILLDVDGTLCRAEALSIDAYYRCLSDVSGRTISNENTKVNLHGQTDVSLLHAILQYHGLDGDEIGRVSDRFFKVHHDYLRESLRAGFESTPCPGIGEALEWLRGQPVFVGLLTGNSRRNALLKVQSAGLPGDMFDLDISSFGDDHMTRAAMVVDSIRKISARHSIPVDPQDVVIIGDTPLDVLCARETGCRAVAVATGSYGGKDLRAYAPEFVCEASLTEAKDYLAGVLAGNC